MSHINICKPGRNHAVEAQALQIAILSAEIKHYKSRASMLESDLLSIFDRVRDGDEVELWYDENTCIEIQAKPKG